MPNERSRLIASVKREIRRRRDTGGPATIANPQPVARTDLQRALMHRELVAWCEWRGNDARAVLNHAAAKRYIRAGLASRPPVTVRPVPPMNDSRPVVAACEDCGYELRLAEGAPVPLPPGVDVYTFPEPPHRLLVWRCNCGAELGVWTDRDGVPVAAAGDRPDGR